MSTLRSSTELIQKIYNVLEWYEKSLSLNTKAYVYIHTVVKLGNTVAEVREKAVYIEVNIHRYNL